MAYIDYDGNEYDTAVIAVDGGTRYLEVVVGSMRVTHLNDGTPIPVLSANGEWSSVSNGLGCCYYDNDNSDVDQYGMIYKRACALDANFANVGWRVMDATDREYIRTAVSNSAKAIASTYGWNASGIVGTPGNDQASNNSTGIGVPPLGVRNWYGGFEYKGLAGNGWNSVGDGLFYMMNDTSEINIVGYTDDQVGRGIQIVRDYTPLLEYNVTVQTSGNGTVIPTGTSAYDNGEVVNISATASEGFKFYRWVSSTGSISIANLNISSTTMTVNGEGTVTAEFVALEIYDVTVTSDDPTCTVIPDGDTTVTEGQILSLQAISGPNRVFREWVMTPKYILINTTGESFSPIIYTSGSVSVEWIFSDGTTSAVNNPIKNFGSSTNRVQKLKVNPWNALRGINLGYDASDDGPSSVDGITLDLIPQQNVSNVVNLNLARYGLRFFLANYSTITDIDFIDYPELLDVEFFNGAIENSLLQNCDKLSRVCYERNNLQELDLSDLPLFADLRAANQGQGALPPLVLDLGTPRPTVWHICVRDNQFANRAMFADMTGWTGLEQLWNWNTNQAGSLVIPNSAPYLHVWAYDNEYTYVNLQGSALGAGENGRLEMRNNMISAVNISGCVGLTYVDFSNNLLTDTYVDRILTTLDSLGRLNGTVILNGTGNSGPSYDGVAAASNLTGKGWTVQLNAAEVLTITTTSIGSLVQNEVMTPVTLQSINGVGDVTYVITSANLPTGVVLSNGVISGTPTTVGSYNFTITATDEDLHTDEQVISGNVTSGAGVVGISVIDSARDVSYASGPTTRTVQMNLTPGSVLAVSVGAYASGGAAVPDFDVQDTHGNTYSHVVGSDARNNPQMRWYTAPITSGGLATITMTCTAVGYSSLSVVAVSGVSATPDVVSSLSNANAHSITTNNTNSIVFITGHIEDSSGAFTYTPNTSVEVFTPTGQSIERPISYRITDVPLSNESFRITRASGTFSLSNVISLRAIGE